MTDHHPYNNVCIICKCDSKNHCFIDREKNAYCYKCMKVTPDKVIYNGKTTEMISRTMLIHDLPMSIKIAIYKMVRIRMDDISIDNNCIIYQIGSIYFNFTSHMDPETAMTYLVLDMKQQEQLFKSLYLLFDCHTIETLASAVIQYICDCKGF